METASVYLSADTEVRPALVTRHIALAKSADRSTPTLIVRPAAGYADRIKGIITVFCVAVLCGRRFVVNWPYRPSLTAALLPNEVGWLCADCPPATVHHEWYSVQRPDIAEAMRRGGFVDWLEAEKFGHARVVQITANQDMLGELLTDPEVRQAFDAVSARALFRCSFSSLFRLNPDSEILARAAPLRSRLRGRASIGVHIRVGENELWSDPRWEDGSSIPRFGEAVQSLTRDKQLSDPVVYFASDSKSLKDAVRDGALFPHLDVVQQAIEPLHIGRAKLPDDSDRVLVETVVDHLMLSCCDHVVCGSGGFAVTAALLGNGSLRRV